MHGALPERRAALRGHVQSSDVRRTASSQASDHDRFLAVVFCSSPMPAAWKQTETQRLLLRVAAAVVLQRVNSKDLARTCIHQIRRDLRQLSIASVRRSLFSYLCLQLLQVRRG